MEYFLAGKNNEVLIHVTIGMNLENILLSERSQPQKSAMYEMSTKGNPQKWKVD